MNRLNSLVRIMLVVLVVAIVATTIGANGCLWVGKTGDQSNVATGSSGVMIAGSPNPITGAVNVPITVQLSWVSVGGAANYDVYLGISPTISYVTNVPNMPIRTRYTPTPLNYGTTYLWRIDTHDALSNTYFGTVWYFTTAVQTFTLTNLNPANGATGVPITPTILSWSAVTNAASYDVYFGITGTPPFFTNVSSPSCSLPLSYNVRYYWHIKAKNGDGTVIATGALWNFTTVSPLSAATAPNPVDTATNVSPSTALSWVPSPVATTYDVWLWSAVPTPTKIATVSKTTPRTTYTPTPGYIHYGTTYMWRVNGNAPGQPTCAGSIWTFTTKTLPSQVGNPQGPADGASNVPINHVLTWTAAANATLYSVYFGVTMPPTFRTNTVLLTYNQGRLLYSTTYHWRIDSRNNVGVTTGIPWSFTTTQKPTPEKATSSLPVSGTLNCPINTALSWASGANADSYNVYFGTVNPPPWVLTNTAKTIYRTSYVPGTLSHFTTYYWRIDAVNSDNPPTPGDVWWFKTILEVPAPITLVAPTPTGVTSCLTTQVLQWGGAARATSYDVYLGTTPTLNASYFKGNTTGTTFTPTGLAYPGITYYWRIDARNSTGITTGTPWSFVTLARPPAAVPTAPPNSITPTVVTTTALTWGAASTATMYKVYLDTVSPPLTLVTQTALTSFSPTLSSGATYHWRVDAVNEAGTTAGAEWLFATTP